MSSTTTAAAVGPAAAICAVPQARVSTPWRSHCLSTEVDLAVDSTVQAEQVRSVATQRLMRRIGRVSPAELTDIDDALRLHLAL